MERRVECKEKEINCKGRLLLAWSQAKCKRVDSGIKVHLDCVEMLVDKVAQSHLGTVPYLNNFLSGDTIFERF